MGTHNNLSNSNQLNNPNNLTKALLLYLKRYFLEAAVQIKFKTNKTEVEKTLKTVADQKNSKQV